MAETVLLIEDEQNVAAFIQQGLQEAGYEVYLAYNGHQGLALLEQKIIDIIILDIILPGMDGIEILKHVRSSKFHEIPILLLTALSNTDSVVSGLDNGADDYLTKPFKFKELIARLRALARRRGNGVQQTDILAIADLELDRTAKSVQRGGQEIKLTSTEFRLLEYLLINKNKVMSRIDILENVWDINFNMGTNVVDVYVNYLRNKVDKKFDNKLIQTVIGMGYIMKE